MNTPMILALRFLRDILMYLAGCLCATQHSGYGLLCICGGWIAREFLDIEQEKVLELREALARQQAYNAGFDDFKRKFMQLLDDVKKKEASDDTEN